MPSRGHGVCCGVRVPFAGDRGRANAGAPLTMAGGPRYPAFPMKAQGEPQGPNTRDSALADLQAYASSVTLAFERYQLEAKGAALVGFSHLV
jgi:hypothetical protein